MRTKSLFLKKNWKMLLGKSGVLLASIYLTFIVDVYTLNTLPKRIFVFCYFLLMCHAALYLKKKLQKGNAISKFMLAAIGILAVAIVLLGHNTLLPKAQEATVSLAAVPCENGSCREVWLTAVQVDGQEIQLSQLELDANRGWAYSGDYDDYVFYPVEEASNTNYLTFKATGKEIVLTFAKNAWSGAVKVMANESDLDTLSLTGGTDTNEATTCTIHSAKYYEIWELVLYGAGAWIVIAYFLLLLLSLANKKTADYNHKGNRTIWVLFATISIVLIWRIMLSRIFLPYVLYPDSAGYMEYPWDEFFRLNLTSGRTPIYPAFLAIIRRICGDGYLSIVPAVQSTIAVISLLFLFRLLMMLTHNDLVAGIVTAGYGVCPDIIVWDYSILSESLALSFTIIFIYLLVSFLHKPKYRTGLKLVGLSVLMIFERPTFLLFGAILFGFWILRMIVYAPERKMLLRLCIASLCTFLLVGLYSAGIHKNFGIYSISDAMPRQNVVTAIARGYYTESSDAHFSELITHSLEKSNGDVWATCGDVLSEFGLNESNRLAKEALFKNIPRYIEDTIANIIGDARCFFAEYYIYCAMSTNIDSRDFELLTIDSLKQELQLRVICLYISELMCLCMLVVSWCRSREIPWLYIGLVTFMAAISITTYIATCGEFSRTMIHVVPFIYVTAAMAINWFVNASQPMEDTMLFICRE